MVFHLSACSRNHAVPKPCGEPRGHPDMARCGPPDIASRRPLRLATRAARLGSVAALLAALALPACKPPPTDDGTARAAQLQADSGPSAPLPSPDVTGAIWAQSRVQPAGPLRLVYGVPGQPVLLSLECLSAATPEARLRITRHAPADNGAGALLALIGNGHIGRLEVDATDSGGRRLWQGEAPAADPGWAAIAGPREATATIPGAGLVRLNPSPLPMQLVAACRDAPAPEPPADQR